MFCWCFKDSVSLSCINYLYFVFAQYTNLCFDTVTLKKNKLYKVSDMKRKKMAVLFHFAFLYMYFVPKVLFTSVNNSVSSAICLEILTVFRIRPLFLKRVCRYWSVPVGLWRRDCAVLLVLICPLPLQPHRDSSRSASAHLWKTWASFLFAFPRSVLSLSEMLDAYQPPPSLLPSALMLGYFNFLPEEGAVVPRSCVASHQ